MFSGPNLYETVAGIARAQRLVAQEAELTGTVYAADFEGTVTGTWVRLDDSGAGVVLYKGKEYTTVRLGITTLFKGSTVQLSYVKGTYYSNW